MYNKGEREQMYLSQLLDNLITFELIPYNYRSEAICSIAVSQDVEAIRITPAASFSEAICLIAMPKNGLLLEFVPDDLKNYKVCSLAIQQNALALQYINLDVLNSDVLNHEQYEELCQSAIEQNGLALEYVLPDFLTYDRCLKAVEKDPRALQFVPDHFKKEIIDKFTTEKLLSINYSLINFFPEDIKEQARQSFLKNIENITINSNILDHELVDAQLTFTAKREGSTIHVNGNNIMQNLNIMLKDLEQVNQGKEIRLVFFGHTPVGADSIAGVHHWDIVDLLEKNQNINHIQLIGCNVAKAKQPQKEKEMIQNYQNKIKSDSMQYGLVSTIDTSIDDPKFQQQCIDYCRKRNIKGVYILNKTEGNNYQLQVIKCDSQYNSVKTKKVTDIPANRVNDGVFDGLNKNKPISFPKKQNTLFSINEKLSDDELKSVRALKYKEDRFHPAHPKYKTDKEKFPFAAKIEAQVSDLKPSLHKTIVDSIAANPNIKRNIKVQGYTKAIYVDTKEGQLIGAKKYLYENYQSSLFKSKDASINKKLLEQERKQYMKEMKGMKEGDDEDTMANQVIVTVKKGPG